jgi:hypothetical protein
LRKYLHSGLNAGQWCGIQKLIPFPEQAYFISVTQIQILTPVCKAMSTQNESFVNKYKWKKSSSEREEHDRFVYKDKDGSLKYSL